MQGKERGKKRERERERGKEREREAKSAETPSISIVNKLLSKDRNQGLFREGVDCGFCLLLPCSCPALARSCLLCFAWSPKAARKKSAVVTIKAEVSLVQSSGVRDITNESR